MLSIRIVTAAAVLVMTVLLALGGADAQAATDAAPGKPIPLLQINTQPHKAKTKTHIKSLAKTARRTTRTHHVLATRKRLRRSTRTAAVVAPAATVAPASVWPSPATAVPAQVAVAEPAPAPAFTEPAPSELVVGGRTVQIASPEAVNDIDLAAKDADTAASPVALSKTTATELQSKRVEAEPGQRAESAVGSASWIARVLAALGGAVAAGSIAWFLIGSAPQRMYG